MLALQEKHTSQRRQWPSGEALQPSFIYFMELRLKTILKVEVLHEGAVHFQLLPLLQNQCDAGARLRFTHLYLKPGV